MAIAGDSEFAFKIESPVNRKALYPLRKKMPRREDENACFSLSFSAEVRPTQLLTLYTNE